MKIIYEGHDPFRVGVGDPLHGSSWTYGAALKRAYKALEYVAA